MNTARRFIGGPVPTLDQSRKAIASHLRMLADKLEKSNTARPFIVYQSVSIGGDDILQTVTLSVVDKSLSMT